MVASLKAHGQIVPLLVKELEGKPGYYDVIAGSRRLAAAQEAKLPDLEVTLYTGQHAAGEVGAVENMLREPMHPLDEAEEIARLIADGEQPQDVAARFGQTKRWAEQRVGVGRKPVTTGIAHARYMHRRLSYQRKPLLLARLRLADPRRAFGIR
jgi:ParB-like nuclease domain